MLHNCGGRILTGGAGKVSYLYIIADGGGSTADDIVSDNIVHIIM